ncbi:alpha-L-fucosidase [Lapidilactobacillus gannanensis]|uniref:alpha-L-fucosidase n=1 Tax=Lapidilactobacillus gannanensis TaxID=2486002 RepID=A0ABW4BJ73_9LACO|nr:alpha-L-fucosidase [Lapidilactobacillus gannanensis]
MTTDDKRADIESAKNIAWTPTDFEGYPEYDSLQKSWRRFNQQKIGVLIHWGLYSVAGIVESWQLSDEDTWARGKHPFRPNMSQLKKDYWGLAQQFNPVHYNPDQWARLFKQAGIQYAIFTTKHHDGFTLYDTKYSDFKITNPKFPYAQQPRADLFGSFTAAMRQEGITPGAYYSKADWHYPAYWRPDGKPKSRHADYQPTTDPQRWQQFVKFVDQQLLEITHNYGSLGMLWLDAGWVNGPDEPLNFDELMPEIRAQQPDLLVVDRTLGGRYENYVTPERQIPTPDKLPVMPWESNVPLSNDWGYVPHADFKSIRTIILDVLKVASLGGNIVLGVGPKPDGSIEPQATKLLQQLGAWLQINGQGIYGTTGVGAKLFKKAQQLGWLLTEDADHYYLFPRKKVPAQYLNLEYFGFPKQISQVALLGSGEQLPFQNGSQKFVRLPGKLRQQLFPGIICKKSK